MCSGLLPFRYNVEEQLRDGLQSVLAEYHLTRLLSAASAGQPSFAVHGSADTKSEVQAEIESTCKACAHKGGSS